MGGRGCDLSKGHPGAHRVLVTMGAGDVAKLGRGSELDDPPTSLLGMAERGMTLEPRCGGKIDTSPMASKCLVCGKLYNPRSKLTDRSQEVVGRMLMIKARDALANHSRWESRELAEELQTYLDGYVPPSTRLEDLPRTPLTEEIDQDLEDAKRAYFDAGGMPSQSTRPREARWYWRRAAQLWRMQAETVPGPPGDNDPCECGKLTFLALGRRRRRIMLDVDRERQAQDRKWGDTLHPPERYLAILVEEVGEVGTAMLAQAFGGRGDLREELVQVAAVAVRMLELIDRRIEGWP